MSMEINADGVENAVTNASTIFVYFIKTAHDFFPLKMRVFCRSIGR